MNWFKQFKNLLQEPKNTKGAFVIYMYIKGKERRVVIPNKTQNEVVMILRTLKLIFRSNAKKIFKHIYSSMCFFFN